MKNATLVAGVCLILFMGCGWDGAQSSQGEQGKTPGQQTGAQAPGRQPLKTVGIVTVKPRKIALSEELPGRVRASVTAEIRPQVSGIIQERLFQEGSFVEKGQQLYQIDPARYEAGYQRARASLQTASAELENARALQARYEHLLRANAISQQEVDNVTARLKQARAAVSLAQAEVKTARIDLEYTRVYSPIPGYIGPSAVTQGALVTAQQAMALAIVRQLDPVYVDLSQSSVQARQLQEGLMTGRFNLSMPESFQVTLLLGTAGEPYPQKGRLEAADLAVDENTGTIKLRSVFANPDGRLLPGMFVRARVSQADAPGSLMVPQKSVSIQPDGSKIVWVVGSGNTVSKRGIRTGRTYKNHWVVTAGLNAGDRVIAEGAMMLRAGMKVNPRELAPDGLQGEESPFADTVRAPQDPPEEPSRAESKQPRSLQEESQAG